MNAQLLNNFNQSNNLSYTILQPVISGKLILIETNKEWMVWYYNKLVVAIIKAMDIYYITHITDEWYSLITICRAGNILIHIIPNKTLSKYLL